MKAENGCSEESQRGYCSFPLHLLSQAVSDLMRHLHIGCKITTHDALLFPNENVLLRHEINLQICT